MAKLDVTIKKFISAAKIERKVAFALDKDLKNISLLTETAIKNRTPAPTGRLKASMTARKVKFLEHEVATAVKYAPYVEFGTSRMAPRAMMRRGARDIRKGRTVGGIQASKLLKNVDKIKF